MFTDSNWQQDLFAFYHHHGGNPFGKASRGDPRERSNFRPGVYYTTKPGRFCHAVKVRDRIELGRTPGHLVDPIRIR
ncbi:MAG: hypothetical protein JO170_02385 [Verrucomicrobia bacterium]|nr:hypothetical protein [Verrucomicrobiota bacterium]